MDVSPSGWETVIGLEVHVQIATQSKMYCACPAINTQEPAQANHYVCPVCLGHPGTLPRPNRQAVVRAMALAKKTGSQLAGRSVFARKNYFYPDLPKGYQISQYDLPLASGGKVEYWHGGEAKIARLVRMHLEEDTAKLFHGEGGSGALLDFNRSSMPLLEIVTEPDFRSGAECVSYLEELRTMLQRLGVSDAAMEAGNFRCEPNVSVRPVGETTLRTKTELKNLNSYSKLRRAVEAEVARQIELYDKGETVVQSTMRYDMQLGATIPMRLKETADDYRYFDDPDIPPLVLSKSMHDEAELHQAPSAFEQIREMVQAQGLGHEQAATIADDEELRRFYELCVVDGHDPRAVAKWVCGELTRLMRDAPLGIEPGELSAVLKLLDEKKVTLMQAREVFEESYRSGSNVAAVFEQKYYGGPQTAEELRSECMEVIEANPKIVTDIRGGKITALQALIGQVLKRTRGSVKPDAARAMLAELLGIDS
ncbi:MAG: Asp-tRNA(Asn)/Glu-tRNA(Gln) amidotransferase subunit GatB [bacterium]|nr:Asp-tRNA(Asn)/Glu-tRNA(Gln) amidotransferase subunit GatB [bacterium]